MLLLHTAAITQIVKGTICLVPLEKFVYSTVMALREGADMQGRVICVQLDNGGKGTTPNEFESAKRLKNVLG